MPSVYLPGQRNGQGGERSDGDLADPFLQGLFGEKELKNDFVRQQTEKLKPLLEARVAELRGQVDSAGSVGEDSDKDTANSRAD